MAQQQPYNPSDYGEHELELRRLFFLQMEDARNYFLNTIKPRLDRSYKLYIAYTGDRQKEIKSWQANIFVPYINAVVETLMPRILDARPDFTVQGRTEDDQLKAPKQQMLCDYLWEISEMDNTAELAVRSSLIYGTGYLQTSWKKDVREHRFLSTKDLLSKKYKYEWKKKTFYDAPFCEWVDNYSLWYDWHNIDRKSKQYWFKRLVLTAPEIKRKYPQADPERLAMALLNWGGDLTDYASVRQLVKSNHIYIIKGQTSIVSNRGIGDDRYNIYGDQRLQMYEVFEWWRPFDDEFAVMVGGSYVPILSGGSVPIAYDFKEAPFIEIPYLKLPNEFEGYGIPMLLENPQIMLNQIKNQRLDATTLSIHKMWIVNPLANVNKDELVTRPFGIIYSVDPNGVREVQFSDIKASAYKEEDLLKADMRYSSGVDDFSMGTGNAGASATEVRHLRESTLERVRLFINHLGSAFSDVLRYWMDMERQFFTEPMYIRILGENGQPTYPLIEKDDLEGKFDYKATVIPSITGMNDVKKKQDMDLFQLLINLPFIDPKKLTTKVLYDWSWSIDSIAAAENAEQGMQPGMEQSQEQQMSPEEQAMMLQQQGQGAEMAQPQPQGIPLPEGVEMGGAISPEMMAQIVQMVAPKGVEKVMAEQQQQQQQQQAMGGAGGAEPSGYGIASRPINLLRGGPPPTVKGVLDQRGANPRGFNRGGKVNTNINIKKNSNPESALMNRVFNIQR